MATSILQKSKKLLIRMIPQIRLLELGSICDWYKRTNAYKKFLNKTIYEVPICGGEFIFIVIQPWLFTPLPWYFITLAMAFQLRGKKVCLIFDDTYSCSGIHRFFFKIQERSISKILHNVDGVIESICLSRFLSERNALMSESYIDVLVEKNKIIISRGECFDAKIQMLAHGMKASLKNTANHIQGLLELKKPNYIIIGGGGYNSSGLWLEFGRKMGIRVASVDAGFSVLLLSTKGIAANLDDIPRAYSLLPKNDSSVIVAAKEEMKRRMMGTDSFSSQVVPAIGRAGEERGYDIVLPLNHSADLAALQRHNVFKNQTEWILETIAWVLDNSAATIAIRRHPCERIKGLATNDDYQSLIEFRFVKNDRVFYIDSNAPINTYDLIERARVVVPYVSTVGIEAAALGKPVVTEGASCYSELGFVWSAKTREEYFNLLQMALNGELVVDKKKQDDAWRCYYLTQCSNWHHTIFTPQPADFDKWVSENPHDLLNSAKVTDVLEAIDQNIPLSILVHNNKKKSRAANVQKVGSSPKELV